MSLEQYNFLINNLLKEKHVLALLKANVTNFIQPYLHQFFNDSHSFNGYGRLSKRPFD